MCARYACLFLCVVCMYIGDVMCVCLMCMGVCVYVTLRMYVVFCMNAKLCTYVTLCEFGRLCMRVLYVCALCYGAVCFVCM